MRVLWFTNGPLPAVQRRLGREPSGSGQWMAGLLEQLRTTDLQIEVATAHPGLANDDFEDAGVRYFTFEQPRFQSIFDFRKKDLQRCVDLVRDRNPDLIHIHGT